MTNTSISSPIHVDEKMVAKAVPDLVRDMCDGIRAQGADPLEIANELVIFALADYLVRAGWTKA